MATYGPGENAFNFDPVEEGGDRTDTAFAKTKAQFDALYENLIQAFAQRIKNNADTAEATLIQLMGTQQRLELAIRAVTTEAEYTAVCAQVDAVIKEASNE